MGRSILTGTRIFLGRRVASVQRNFPYRIRHAIRNFPPVEGNGAAVLLVLAQSKTWWDALWSAWSWMRFVKDECKVHLVMDGPVSAEQRRIFHKLFPRGKIQPAEEILREMKGWSVKACNFFRHNLFGRKVAIVLQLSLQSDLLYSDADVLVFKRPDEILDNMRGERRPLCLEENKVIGFDPCVYKYAEELQLTGIRHINSGVMFLPREKLGNDLARSLIEKRMQEPTHRFTEQSLFSALLHAASTGFLNRELYVLNNQGKWFWEKDIDYSRVKLRHFSGAVRHRLYLKGMPILKQEVEGRAA